MSDPKLSVVIATYNRPDSLLRIVRELAAQTLPAAQFEVIVVDDGSREPVAQRIEAAQAREPQLARLPLRVHRQANGGAARARQCGAELAHGELLLFLDDDMVLPPELLAEHLAAHQESAGQLAQNRVVMGRLRAAENLASMPLFERFYAKMLDRFAAQTAQNGGRFAAESLYTGNLSLPRALFFRAGGFDVSFGQIEDAELGVRLAGCGAEFHFSEAGYTIHASDHISRDKWLKRSVTDGKFWTRLARKHPEVYSANPWRYLGGVNPLSRPVLALVVLAPFLADPLARSGLSAAELLDRFGLERAALAGTTLVYGVQYFQGVRRETGTLAQAAREYAAFLRGIRVLSRNRASSQSLWDEVRADHQALLRSQGKYGGGSSGAERSVLSDAVQNIGFQMLIGYRTMRALQRSGHGLAAKFVSRLLRHAYGSDLHWESEIAPGVVVVHGFGLAIAPGVRVDAGCILFQHVTLGRGLDPDSKQAGVPHLCANVHVGVGATVVGPLTVGENSKIMPGCTVLRSVPARSVVAAQEPEIKPRAGA